MEPGLAIVSPKPVKTYYKTSSLKRTNTIKINIDLENEKDHPNSTKNYKESEYLGKKTLLFNYGNITSSTTMPEDCIFTSVSVKNKKSEKTLNSLKFFEDFENELTQQESQEEILSILFDSNTNDKSNRHENSENSRKLDIFHSSGCFEVKKDSFDGDISLFFRSSLPPSRPKNPFFRSINDCDKEYFDNLEENLKKGISEDFVL